MNKIYQILTVLLTLGGVTLVPYGVYLIHAPSGFIVAGVACFVLEYLIRPDTERGDSG